MEHITRARAALAATLILPLALLGCTNATTPSASTAATGSSPVRTGEETRRPAASPSAAPSAHGSHSPLGDSQECENEEIGYEVEFPEGWWANERIEPDFEGGTPIPACTYFAPEPVPLQPNAGLPGGIAIWFNTPSADTPESQGEVLGREETTVDDHDAIVVEYEPPAGGFTPEGTIIYKYVLATRDGQLAAMTDALRHPDYEENKEILDAMMETLELDD